MTYDPSQAEAEIRETRHRVEELQRDLAIERDIADRSHFILKHLADNKPFNRIMQDLLDELFTDYRNTRKTNNDN